MSHSFKSLQSEELPPNALLLRTTRASFEVTIEGHTRYVREMFKQVEGDDDIEPFAILDFNDATLIVPLGGFFGSEMAKEILASAILPGLIGIYQPWCVSFVTPSWAVFEKRDITDEKLKSAKTYDDLGVVRPSENPDRIEVITICVQSAEEETALMGKVRRRKDRKPQLRKFKPFGQGAYVAGRFPEAIRRQLKLNAMG